MSRHLTVQTVCTNNTVPSGVPAAPTVALGLFDLNESSVPARTRAVPLGADHDSWYDLDERLTVTLGRANSQGPLPAQAAGALAGADRIEVFTSGARFERTNLGLEVASKRDPLEVANGDPLVVSTRPDPLEPFDPEGSTIATLGTGFDSLTHLRNQLALASQTGDATQHISADAASVLHNTDFARVYTLAVRFSVNPPDTSASPTE